MARSVEDVRSERGGAAFLAREARVDGLLSRMAIEEALGDPERLVAVGTLEGSLLAGCLVAAETLSDGSRLGRIEWLYVDPAARSVGLGEEVRSLAESWASDRGASALDTYALVGDRDTKNFLESAGFAARLIVMHRRLP